MGDHYVPRRLHYGTSSLTQRRNRGQHHRASIRDATAPLALARQQGSKDCARRHFAPPTSVVSVAGTQVSHVLWGARPTIRLGQLHCSCSEHNIAGLVFVFLSDRSLIEVIGWLAKLSRPCFSASRRNIVHCWPGSRLLSLLRVYLVSQRDACWRTQLLGVEEEMLSKKLSRSAQHC
jgi:hypothetical protein